MNKLEARIQALEARRAQQRGIDGDDELAALASRDGYDLSLMPGKTLSEKVQAVVAAYQGDLEISPEARHAARGWFEIQDAV